MCTALVSMFELVPKVSIVRQVGAGSGAQSRRTPLLILSDLPLAAPEGNNLYWSASKWRGAFPLEQLLTCWTLAGVKLRARPDGSGQ